MAQGAQAEDRLGGKGGEVKGKEGGKNTAHGLSSLLTVWPFRGHLDETG